MTPTLTKIRKDIYERSFEIMQLQKEIPEDKKKLFKKMKRLEYLIYLERGKK